ncbi:hypothetical protein D1007_47991 [Hordeum vulgare]|nr:hypothetical protein D1007_47991 [Hordeum vulgare]
MDGPPVSSWEGLVMTDKHIDYLQWTRKLPLAEVAGARAPEPCTGEHVVFATHSLIGFGLPRSLFLRHFLDFYRLQMHHLGPNSVLYLVFFTTLCES